MSATNNEEDNRKHIDFDLNLKVLHYLGVLPPPDVHGYGRSTLYQCYTVLGVLLLGSCISSMVIDLVVCWGDFNTLTVNVCNILSLTVCLYKLVKTVQMRDDIHGLLERLDTIFMVYIGHSGDSEHILEESEWHARAVTLGFLGLGGIAVALQCFMRPLQFALNTFVPGIPEVVYHSWDGCHNKDLPMIAWLPFNTTVSPNYEIAYMYHVVAQLYSFMVSSSLDVFYVSIIIHICGELKLLQFSLLHVTDRATSLLEERQIDDGKWINSVDSMQSQTIYNEVMDADIGSGDYQTMQMKTPPTSGGQIIRTINGEQTLHRRGHVWEVELFKYSMRREDMLLNAEMYVSLIRCIEHHQELLTFTMDLEDRMNYLMIVQFIGSMIIICMALFQVTVSTGDTPSLIKFIFYLLSMSVQILLYCWYGQDLIEQSVAVHWSAYCCNWLDSKMIFKNSIRMIITRALHPLELTAGKFYVISLHSFLVILNASFSFFAVLRQITRKQEAEAAGVTLDRRSLL